MVPFPEMWNFKNPWQHQRDAFSYMAEMLKEKGSCGLFSGMGTGKSAVLVGLLQHFKPYVSLIVCEKNMVETWGKMFEEYDPAFNYQVVLLPSGIKLVDRAARVNRAFRECPTDYSLIFITNYEAVWQGALGKELKKYDFDLIALDESHRIKSPSGKASVFLYRLGKNSAYRIAMTGTPSHDKPIDVYAQYRFLDDSIFGTSMERFKQQYVVEMQRQNYRQIVGYKNQEELSKKMYTRAFRVPESVLDLPPLVLSDRWVTLEPEAREKYEAFKQDLVLEMDQGVVVAGNVLVRALRLQQIANGFTSLTDLSSGQETIQKVSEAKLDALVELFRGIPEEEPIVVFGRFHADLDQTQVAAAETGRRYIEQSGRKGSWGEWQFNCKGGEVLGVQIQSGGSGIDLTRAKFAIYFTTGHSLGQYEQSLRRLHRPKQKGTVNVYHLWAEKTIDTAVRKALRQKGDVAKMIVDELQGRT